MIAHAFIVPASAKVCKFCTLKRMYVTVVTSSRSKGIGNGLTYETDEKVLPGCLVKVPLRNQVLEGIVLDINVPQPQADVKRVHSVLSKEPIVPDHMLKLAKWMSEYYLCSQRQAFQVLLPAPPWLHLCEEVTTEVVLIQDIVLKGKKQQIVVETLKRGPVERRQLLAETGTTSAVLKTLFEKGIIDFVEKKKEVEQTETELKASHAHLKELFQGDKPTLFFDKSFIGREGTYAQIAEHVLSNKKSVLVLASDVFAAKNLYALLRHTISRAVLLHGRMSVAEQRRSYRQLRASTAQLVIGTRSALFAPLSDLGAVIVDDEHAWTYKNEQTPRYHAVKTALALSEITQAKCILTSATPSLETFVQTMGSKASMHRATLEGPMRSDRVDIVDLTAVKFGTLFPFTPTLLDALKSQLQQKKQSVLFLNHRGVSTTLLCAECKHRFLAKETGLPLTVHEENGVPYLVDHHTSERTALPDACPNCGSNRLIQVGAGTQRIENLLKTHFPKARVERVDRDALEKTNTLEDIVRRTEYGQADILIGTTPVLKALHAKNVTFAAALIADIGMSAPDYRASEENAELLFSLARAMRAKTGGRLLIQTYRPDAPEIVAAKTSDYETYAKSELKVRSMLNYPPFSKMAAVIVRGMNAKAEALHIKKELMNAPLVSVSAYPALSERQTWYVLLRGDNPRACLEKISLTHAVIDIDPLTTA